MRGDGKGDPLRVGGGYSPAWSPDGKRLTFVSYERDSVGKHCRLHLVTADGTELATRAGGQAEWLSTGELLMNSSDEGWLLLDRDGRELKRFSAEENASLKLSPGVTDCCHVRNQDAHRARPGNRRRTR